MGTLVLSPIIWKPCDAPAPSLEEQRNLPITWLPQAILSSLDQKVVDLEAKGIPQ